jgi:hypothetical protein
MVETDRGRALLVEEVLTGGGFQGGGGERVRVGQGVVTADGGDAPLGWPRPGGLPPPSLTPPHNHPFPKPHKHTPHPPCCEYSLVASTVRVLCAPAVCPPLGQPWSRSRVERLRLPGGRPMVETDRSRRALSVEEVPKRGGLQGGDTERVRVGQGGGDGGRRERAAWPRPGGLPPSSLAPSHNYPFPPPHQHNPHHPCCEYSLVACTVRVL